MIVLVSLHDSLAKKTSCPHCFSHDASLRHCLFSRMFFYIGFTYFCEATLVYIACICSCMHAQTYGAAPSHHVLSSVKMASCLVAVYSA